MHCNETFHFSSPSLHRHFAYCFHRSLQEWKKKKRKMRSCNELAHGHRTPKSWTMVSTNTITQYTKNLQYMQKWVLQFSPFCFQSRDQHLGVSEINLQYVVILARSADGWRVSVWGTPPNLAPFTRVPIASMRSTCRVFLYVRKFSHYVCTYNWLLLNPLTLIANFSR